MRIKERWTVALVAIIAAIAPIYMYGGPLAVLSRPSLQTQQQRAEPKAPDKNRPYPVSPFGNKPAPRQDVLRSRRRRHLRAQ